MALSDYQNPLDPRLQNPIFASAPPPDVPISLPQAPAPTSIFKNAPPQVKLTSDPLERIQGHAQNQLEELQRKDANPYGSRYNHPGTLGKIAHVLGVAGNIAGDIFAPAAMENIPGTELNRKSREAGLQNEIQSTEKAKSERDLQGAEAAHANAQVPLAEAQTEQAKKQAENLQSEIDDRQFKQEHPDLAGAYAHRVSQVLAQNGDPSQDPVVQHLADAITSIQRQTDKGLSYQTAMGPDGKPHVYGLDSKGNKVADIGEHYERPVVTNVNAGLNALDRESARLAKPYEKGLSDADAQLEKIADARNMVNGSAESQALSIPKVLTALVSGQGTGVRITQAELNSIARARGIAGDFEGTLNQWSGKGHLSAAQKQQLTQILDDVRNRITKKQMIHSAALDAINGAGSREDAVKADKTARQQMNEVSQYGFYTGEKILGKGTVVGFRDGKVQVDDAR